MKQLATDYIGKTIERISAGGCDVAFIHFTDETYIMLAGSDVEQVIVCGVDDPIDCLGGEEYALERLLDEGILSREEFTDWVTRRDELAAKQRELDAKMQRLRVRYGAVAPTLSDSECDE